MVRYELLFVLFIASFVICAYNLIYSRQSCIFIGKRCIKGSGARKLCEIYVGIIRNVIDDDCEL